MNKFVLSGAILCGALLTACNGGTSSDTFEIKAETYTEEQQAANGGDAETFNSKHISYALGYGAGGQLLQNLGGDASDVDLEGYLEGFKQGIAEGDPKFTDEYIRKQFELFQPIIAERRQAKQVELEAERDAEAKVYLDEANAFLAKNKSAEGVVSLESGLQYKIITAGDGEIPTAADKVSAHYAGKLINGEEFDSSYKRGEPTTFPVTGVIKGWQEALQLMPKGSKWELYVPPNLGYGEAGRPGIPPNSLMIFTVELVDINPE